MKKILLGVALAALAVSCVDQALIIRGSGKVAMGAFDISPDYTELSVARGIVVNLVDSETGEGLIVADEDILGYVSIVEEGGSVKVSYEPHIQIRTGEVKTVVTMPVSTALARLTASSSGKITYGGTIVRPSEKMTINCTSSGDVKIFGLKSGALAIHCSSSGDLEVTNVETGELKANLSSSGDCTLSSVSCDIFDISASSSGELEGKVSARELHASLSSSGDCEISGTAGNCVIKANSSGDFDGYGLVCQTVDATASSGGAIGVAVTESIVATASSGGAVRYKGSPANVKRNVSSGGSVNQIQ